MICPVYIAEIAPPAWRGRLGALFQLGIVLGIFATLFINRQIQSLGGHQWNVQSGWRWMLAAEALPALVFIVLLVPIPESPKWLVQAGREDEARATLMRIGGPDYAAAEVATVREVLAQEEGSFAELFSRRLPAAAIDRRGYHAGLAAQRHQRGNVLFHRHLQGGHRRRPRGLHVVGVDRFRELDRHLHRHPLRRRGRAQAAALAGQRRASRRAGGSRLRVRGQSPFARACSGE